MLAPNGGMHCFSSVFVDSQVAHLVDLLSIYPLNYLMRCTDDKDSQTVCRMRAPENNTALQAGNLVGLSCSVPKIVQAHIPE